MVPGPNPQLVWVEQTAPPLPTTAPPLEACYGCDCLFADSGDLITGGSLSNQYTCIGGKSTAQTPKIKWAGVPKNSGVGHPILQASGTQCIKSQSFAVVVEDLDYPYGVGQKGHRHEHLAVLGVYATYCTLNSKSTWGNRAVGRGREVRFGFVLGIFLLLWYE